jgi:membrane carboxypeptidase/penicillin-binding protein
VRLRYKILLVLLALVLIFVAGVCSWLFVYTGDLPEFDHLSQFAPNTQVVLLDSCLPGPSTSLPFDRIGKPFQDALVTAEPFSSLPDRIASTLMCNRRERAIQYELDTIRLSWHIRIHFSEQQLLTIYANRAYFGAGMTGVQNASKDLFRKDPEALSVDEAALIAGLLRAPAALSPRKHPEQALLRRNKVLEEMVAKGKLSASDAARLEATPLVTQ